MPVQTLVTASKLALVPEDSFFYELDECVSETGILLQSDARSGSRFVTLNAGQTLEAPGLLPGLRIPVAKIFKPK